MILAEVLTQEIATTEGGCSEGMEDFHNVSEGCREFQKAAEGLRRFQFCEGS